MKMIIAIVPDTDNEAVSQSLLSQGFRVTTIASSGGFLRRGTSTLMIGLEDDKVEEAIEIIKGCCAPPVEPGLKRGSLFVLNVAHFDQL
jgi:uncharacterized protein YaaQ